MRKFNILLFGVLLLVLSCTTESYDGNQELEATKLVTTLPSNAVIIDFEEFSTGDIVSTTSPDGCDGSISVFGTNPAFAGSNTAMVFDSSNPTGDDFDLGTPNSLFGGPGMSADGDQPSNDTALGNVLIISEDLDSGDPDDSYIAGSKYEFNFSAYGNGSVTLFGFDMLDLESPGAGGLLTSVTLYDAGNAVLLNKVIPYGACNAKQFVDLEATENVVRMVIELNNSGAIDNIALECPEIEIGGCETAFGKATSDALCFIDDNTVNFNRWGWTNGPFGTGVYTFDLYAGAGQCDTSKGALAGTVTVDYNAVTGIAAVTYNTNGNWVLTETHLYIGDGPYPLQQKGKKLEPTVAPGQYPHKNDQLNNVFSDPYVIDGLSGDIYIIAHAVVCEVIN